MTQIIKKGEALYIYNKNVFIGSIGATQNTIVIYYEKVANNYFIRYNTSDGLVQFVCTHAELQKIGGENNEATNITNM